MLMSKVVTLFFLCCPKVPHSVSAQATEKAYGKTAEEKLLKESLAS